MMTQLSNEAIADRIIADYKARGHRSYGENVSELEHALQTAEFAKQFGESEAVILSCLLHDYGHLLHDLGEDIADHGIDAKHEDLGAQLLKDLFPAEIVEPVRLHVTAKRYLCAKEPAYLNGLSASSVQSLHLQGGPMSDEEVREFEAHPHFEAAVRVRRYDDMGKVPEMQTATIDSYRRLLQKFLV